MEERRRQGLRGLFRFARCFFLPVTSSNFSQTFRRGTVLDVKRRHSRLVPGIRRIILARFGSLAVFVRQNLGLLQVFIGVDVTFFFLLRGLSRFLAARGFGNILLRILRV
jgi:hypothetical protein